MEKANRNATTAELDLRKELDLQRKRMEEEISALSLQHNKRLEELIEKHKEELKKLEGLKDEEIKVHAGLFQVFYLIGECSHSVWYQV